ncbi:hypothetical protein SROCM77S_03974 [Streptomyces rochei]|uniref:hypothetical protein n=1 Tax=Streptomyces sp. NRRL WC-3795 TaxID=1463938 RepID=UPI0004C5D4C5|nr:hypothetical protein [Streptomyces sp. NRRL WC-3795]
MNTTQPTAAPRAAEAVAGALAARKRLALTGVIARQLDQIAPGTARVRIVPVTTDRDGEQRVATWVSLDDALGLPLKADRAAHRAARGLLRRAFPAADWTRAHAYDVAAGDLALDAPTLPEELHQ